MATYTQANQPLALTTPLGPDTLLLARFDGPALKGAARPRITGS